MVRPGAPRAGPVDGWMLITCSVRALRFVFAPLPVVTVEITQPPLTARPSGIGARFDVAPAPAVSVAPGYQSNVDVVEADIAADAPGYRPMTVPSARATWRFGSGVCVAA